MTDENRQCFVVESVKLATNPYRFVRLSEGSQASSFLLDDTLHFSVVDFASATMFQDQQQADSVRARVQHSLGGTFQIRHVDCVVRPKPALRLPRADERPVDSTADPITKSPMLDITIRLHEQTGHIKAYGPGSLYSRCGPVSGAFMLYTYDQTQSVILPRSLATLIEEESKWIAVYSHDSDEYLQLVGIGDAKEEAYEHLFFPTPHNIANGRHRIFGRLVEPRP